jgi:hypothetical protein
MFNGKLRVSSVPLNILQNNIVILVCCDMSRDCGVSGGGLQGISRFSEVPIFLTQTIQLP